MAGDGERANPEASSASDNKIHLGSGAALSIAAFDFARRAMELNGPSREQCTVEQTAFKKSTLSAQGAATLTCDGQAPTEVKSSYSVGLFPNAEAKKADGKLSGDLSLSQIPALKKLADGETTSFSATGQRVAAGATENLEATCSGDKASMTCDLKITGANKTELAQGKLYIKERPNQLPQIEFSQFKDGKPETGVVFEINKGKTDNSFVLTMGSAKARRQ